MYGLEIRPEADKIFWKLSKKNPGQLMMIHKKIAEIRDNPNHDYKFLRNPLQNFNRVHIDKHFVIIFRIDHQKSMIEIFYFNHHDKVYKWKPKTD